MTQIQTDARKWFETFGARFGTHSIVNTPAGLYWHYTAGSLIFETPEYKGGYYFPTLIKTYYFCNWQTASFLAGLSAYLGGAKNRDENPFPKSNFFDFTAWDVGFIMGIYKLTPETFLERFKTK